MRQALLKGFGAVLDGLDIAFCAFDGRDRTLAWNRTFLQFFPEHDGQVHAGEPYAENLRRFYACRLSGDEAHQMERYVEEGVARHRAQLRPFEFNHRGMRVRVSSLDIPGLGQVRAWRKVADLPEHQASPARSDALDANVTGVLDRIGDGVLVVDDSERAVWANRAFLDLYGLCLGDVLGKTFECIYDQLWAGGREEPDYIDSVTTLRENQRFTGAPFEVSLPGQRWVRIVEQPSDHVNGFGYLMHVDITASKREQKALLEAQVLAKESEGKYRLLAEYSSDVITAVADGILIYVSPSVQETLGWAPEDILGRRVASICHPDDAPDVDVALQALKGAPEADYRARALRADGTYVWVETRARMSSQLGASGAPVIVLNVRSIAARKALEDQLAAAHRKLEELATTDGLTGLANRRRFDEALDVECRRAQRENLPLSLVLFDVDHFKELNDTQGHQAGDRVLKRIGALLAATANRAGDVASRFGGDEFALLLPNTSQEKAAAIAERMRTSVLALHSSAFAAMPVTVSVGVSGTDNLVTDGTPSDLMRVTDAMLYAAKRRGRNRVALASNETLSA
jgi:diguanylate cyclase